MPRTPAQTDLPSDSSLPTADPTLSQQISISADVLAAALAKAIETSRPARITIANRKRNTPWTPKDGVPKLRLKRPLYQHGMEVLEDRLTNEQIELANQLRPGLYCDNYIKVIRRRDKAIDITYPVKTSPQRLKLVTDYGIRNFTELLSTCVTEAKRVKEAKDKDEDSDL